MSGLIAGDKKHIVVLEIHGPKTKKQYDAFTQELATLARKHGGKIILKARTKKRG